MDFMKWLNSLDELLYEVMSWIIFFPITLWRAIRHPLAMMAYADRQLGLPEDDQYADGLSPPLFLALSLIVAHMAGTALGEVDRIVASRHGLSALITDDTSALLLRLLVFSLFPLLLSVQLVRKRRLPLERETLRLPFYAQCYPAAVFALLLNGGMILINLAPDGAHLAGIAIVCFALVNYIAVQTHWFAAQLDRSLPRALGIATAVLLQGFVLVVAAGLMFRG